MDDFYYDRQGNPVPDVNEWARVFEAGIGNRHVAMDSIGQNLSVSTVWLGLNQNWTRVGPPLIFETMVFTNESEELPEEWDGQCWRYSTEAEAISGHEAICAELRVLMGIETPTDQQQSEVGNEAAE